VIVMPVALPPHRDVALWADVDAALALAQMRVLRELFLKGLGPPVQGSESSGVQ
jgi:hypothetical protein